jgi:hypothetical protein
MNEPEEMPGEWEVRNVCPDSGLPCPCLPGSTSEGYCYVAKRNRTVRGINPESV